MRPAGNGSGIANQLRTERTMIAPFLLPLAELVLRDHIHDSDDHTGLGFLIIGAFIAVVALLAFMLGKRSAPPPAADLRCPRCQAPRRGKFCSVCGTKF